jgi:hypothetical protein
MMGFFFQIAPPNKYKNVCGKLIEKLRKNLRLSFLIPNKILN